MKYVAIIKVILLPIIKKRELMKQNPILTNESNDGTQTDKYNLQRFLDAQSHYYEQALQEVQNGYKSSHWIWSSSLSLLLWGTVTMPNITVSADMTKLKRI